MGLISFSLEKLHQNSMMGHSRSLEWEGLVQDHVIHFLWLKATKSLSITLHLIEYKNLGIYLIQL